MFVNQVSKKYVRKEVAQEIHDKVLPFIKWLQEAEEEDSSEDEDDNEEVEVQALCLFGLNNRSVLHSQMSSFSSICNLSSTCLWFH